MKTIVALLLVALITLQCSEEEEPVKQPGKKQFTLVVKEDFPTNYSADWLIIHDVKGKLLFSKLFDAGDTVTFQSDEVIEQDKLNITLMAYTLPGDGRTYTLNSYLFIPVGEQWVLQEDGAPYSHETVGGTFKVTATDIPNNASLVLSDRQGNHGIFEPGQSSGTFSALVPRYSNMDDFLVTMRDEAGNYSYKFINDTKVNEEYTFTPQELKAPDKLIEVSFPLNEFFVFSVEGWNSQQLTTQSGYRLWSGFLDRSDKMNAKLGFVDELDYYNTIFKVSLGRSEYKYFRSGSPPQSINLPFDQFFLFETTSIQNFTYTTNTSFQRRVSTWYLRRTEPGTGRQTRVDWTVNSPEGIQNIGPLPDEFAKIYPDFLKDRLTFGASEFYLTNSDYSSFIEANFKGGSEEQSKDIYSIWVY